MRMRWFVPLMMIALLVGCQQNKKPTQNQLAAKRWNTARASVLQSLATDQFKSGNLDKCRQTVEEAMRLDPANAALRVLSAKLAIEQSQLERAEKELKLARECDPTNAEADYLSGVIFQRWHKPQAALEFYRAAVEKAPSEPAYVLACAEMLVATDAADEAIALLRQKVNEFEHSAAVRDTLGQVLQQQGRHIEAVDSFRHASILAPDDPTIREHLAIALYYAQRYDESANHLARLTRRPPLDKRPDLLLALGECQLHMGRPRDARANFETVTRLTPGNAAAWLGLAKASIQLNDLKRAELSLRKAMLLEPTSGEVQLMTGYLRLRQNRLSEALSAFHRASAVDRSDTVSLCMIGYALEKMDRREQALQYYAQALKIKPTDELAAKLLAGLDVGP